jgi:Spy/CpxP family protein refolding chaperone
MNRIRSLAIAAMLMVALTVLAQQSATAPAGTDKEEHGQPSAHRGIPPVDQHLKLLTEKLDLTDDQQAKTRSILKEMNDASQKITQDENLSREERMTKVRASRMKADKQLRVFLTDDQKKKLDQLEQEPHPGLHDNGNGATQPAQPKI